MPTITAYAFFMRPTTNNRMTAPATAVTSEPISPPADIPSKPNTKPPKTAPMTPTIIFPRRPKPPPFIIVPASHPATAPIAKNISKDCISIFISSICIVYLSTQYLAKSAASFAVQSALYFSFISEHHYSFPTSGEQPKSNARKPNARKKQLNLDPIILIRQQLMHPPRCLSPTSFRCYSHSLTCTSGSCRWSGHSLRSAQNNPCRRSTS